MNKDLKEESLKSHAPSDCSFTAGFKDDQIAAVWNRFFWNPCGVMSSSSLQGVFN